MHSRLTTFLLSLALLGCVHPRPPQQHDDAQPVTQADLVGGWRATLGYDSLYEAFWRRPKAVGTTRLMFWPDGLWWFGGDLYIDHHGGARWRLIGDTLWLGNDYVPYFHTQGMIEYRIGQIIIYGYAKGALDPTFLSQRPPFAVPDSVYWSNTFRDTTSVCASGEPGKGGCGTWVYKVTKRGDHLYLVRLDALSKLARNVANRAVLTHDSLATCKTAIQPCE